MRRDYRLREQDLRLSVTWLDKGESLVDHVVYRQPAKVVFSFPAYRQERQSGWRAE